MSRRICASDFFCRFYCLAQLFLLVVQAGPVAAEMSVADPVPRVVSSRTVTVGVPQSEIPLEPLRFKAPNPVEFEFAASNLAPKNFVRGSFSGVSSKLTKTEIPGISINRLGQLVRWTNGLVLTDVLGINFMQLSRTTATNYATISAGESDQTLNMYMARIGLELSWRHLLPFGFEPYLSASLLPTWATAPESVYENSIGVGGLPYEGAAGLLWRVGNDSKSELGHGDFSVGVEGQALAGKVGGSSLVGAGVEGLVRISL